MTVTDRPYPPGNLLVKIDGAQRGSFPPLPVGQAGAFYGTDPPGAMFTPDDRKRLRDELIAAARADGRVTSAALTGSAALGSEDRWSDIDLALGVVAGADASQVIADWTDRMYQDHGAAHHVDVNWGDVLFRVFLLAGTLQVDLAFWPQSEFGAIAPTFRLLFGTARERPALPAPSAAGLIGMGWLHALHARSSIARGRAWQAEYMISGVRDQVLALACLRHGAPAVQARGVDGLPPGATAAVADSLVCSLDAAELRRAFAVVTEALVAEIERADADFASRLAPPYGNSPDRWRRGEAGETRASGRGPPSASACPRAADVTQFLNFLDQDDPTLRPTFSCKLAAADLADETPGQIRHQDRVIKIDYRKGTGAGHVIWRPVRVATS